MAVTDNVDTPPDDIPANSTRPYGHPDVAFTVPGLYKPRDRYRADVAAIVNEGDAWDSTEVVVTIAVSGAAIRHEDDGIAHYVRNYPTRGKLDSFEPFRQLDETGRWHDYALISHDYTRSSVLDLATGAIIADEDESYYDNAADEPRMTGAGFCPVEFYVPDWWDIHDGSIKPGSEYWSDDMLWPRGEFGFVSGCHWGDDDSWKIQLLDLRRIREGIITRDALFGYVPVAGRLKDAVRVDPESRRIGIAVELSFGLDSGHVDSYTIGGLAGIGGAQA